MFTCRHWRQKAFFFLLYFICLLPPNQAQKLALAAARDTHLALFGSNLYWGAKQLFPTAAGGLNSASVGYFAQQAHFLTGKKAGHLPLASLPRGSQLSSKHGQHKLQRLAVPNSKHRQQLGLKM